LTILKRVGKILAWTIGSLIALLIIVFLLLQLPGVQNWVKDRAVAFLEKKLGTDVEVARLSIQFPKKVVLEGVYFEDQKGDTLLAGEYLGVELAMLKLLKSEVEVEDVELRGIRANITRVAPDTVFNFDYIVRAFAVADTTPVDTTAAPLRLAVDRVRLERITATFHDDLTGNDAYASLGELEARIGETDLEKNAYELRSLVLDGLTARVRQYKPLMESKPVAVREAEAAEPVALALKVGTVDLKRIDAAYDNSVSALSARLNLGELFADIDTLDLGKLYYNLDLLRLKNTQATVVLGATQGAAVVAQEATEVAEAQAALPYKFVVDKTDISGLDFRFDNNTLPRAAVGMDYAHLDTRGLVLDVNNLAVTPTQYFGTVNRAAFREENARFQLKNLATAFAYTDTGAYLNDLFLETGDSRIQGNIALAWPSLDTLTKDPGALRLNVNMPQSRVASRDVLLFAPMLASVPPFQKAPTAVYTVALVGRGSVRDLQISNAEVSGLQGTYARVSGRILGLPDPVRTFYDLQLHSIRTTASDLDRLMPAGTLPPTVRIPEAAALTGTFRGRAADFTTALDLKTTRGNVLAQARLVDFGASYTVNAAAANLDLGYILKQEATMGKITARVQAAGSGFDPATASADFKASVASATFNGYTYRNVDASGQLRNGIATINADARDPAADFAFNGTVNLRGAFPAVAGNLALDSINLQALGFSPTPLKIHGDISLNLESTDPANLVGTVQIANGIFFANGRRFTTDTISVAAYNSADSGHVIRVLSEAVVATLAGQYDLAQIGPAVMNVINRYYNLPGYTPTPTAPQAWTLTARVFPSPLLFAFVPVLEGSDTVDARIAFNSEASDLNALVTTPRLAAAGVAMDSLRAEVATGGPSLQYSVRTAGGGMPTLRLYETTVRGAVANNVASFALASVNAASEPFYALAGSAQQVGADGFRLSLSPDSLLLDGDRWSVPAGNFVEYTPAGILAQDFVLSNGGQSLALQSAQPVRGAPLNATFTNFQIRTLTDFANQDTALVDGVINGTATVTGATTAAPVFTSNLAVENIAFRRDTLGTVTAKVNNETAGAVAADVALTGFGNDVQLTGLYYIAGQRLDMDLAIRNLELAKLPGLSFGAVDAAGGSLQGQLAVDGTLTAPVLVGSVHFDSAYVTPALLGSRFTIPSDDIFVTAEGLRFDGFNVYDSLGNVATLNGNVYTRDYINYRFGLDLTARDFWVANARRRGGSQAFYGALNITTDVKLRGTSTAPEASAFLRVNKGTDLKVLIPTANPEVESREGVVRFVDRDQPNADRIFASADTIAARSASLVGMDVSATIETDTAAQFTLIIDERTGDAVAVRGRANLVGGIDPSGKVDLTGTYQLQNGSYQLTLQFLKRRFTIQPGSTITFMGDPTNGMADVTALYVANTAPLELVENQLSGSSQTEQGRYRQRLPFQVLLRMRGELLKPEITFDIQLADRYLSQYREVEAKLASIRNDPAELNKQVFALLLLNRFVDETPLKNDAGGGSAAERYVRQSASRILTDQLNKLAGNLIRGVDLAFGVTSGDDYTTGTLQQRTDLNVSLSKRLLSDRLRVSVGNNFELEGPRQANTQASQIAADVNIEYQLSSSGRYLVRAYRRNSYQDVVIGQAIENGATFVLNLDYNRLRDVFAKSPEARERKRLKRQLKATQGSSARR